MTERGAILLAGAAVLVVGALAFYGMKRAGVLPGRSSFDPTSRENLAYRGVNAVGAALTGDQSFSLGARIFEWTHSEPDLRAPSSPAALLVPVDWIAPDSQIAPYFAP